MPKQDHFPPARTCSIKFKTSRIRTMIFRIASIASWTLPPAKTATMMTMMMTTTRTDAFPLLRELA
jgi:hypothetical protein